MPQRPLQQHLHPRFSTSRQTEDLYVRNLAANSTAEGVQMAFESVCDVVRVALPLDAETENCRGFAFVTVSAGDAAKICADMDGSFLGGRRIAV
ncbi:hypothetical protein M885DRAFT_437169, partial [Pelagophyceae sp. CCMP2097]